MMNHPSVGLAVNDGNIIRDHIERAAKLCGKSFAVNVVMNHDRSVAGVFSGDPVRAQREGSALCRKIAAVKTEEADVVISAEGYPEAVNLYQFTKVVPPAGRIVKPRGAIICAGSCGGGIGGMTVVNDITCKIGFRHMLPKGVRLYLVSDLPKNSVRKMEFTYAATINEAISREKKRQKKDTLLIAVLAGAGLMVPDKTGARDAVRGARHTKK
jgi:nickel-dependent lactate racemase